MDKNLELKRPGPAAAKGTLQTVNTIVPALRRHQAL